jgi:hypothetical protein
MSEMAGQPERVAQPDHRASDAAARPPRPSPGAVLIASVAGMLAGLVLGIGLGLAVTLVYQHGDIESLRDYADWGSALGAAAGSAGGLILGATVAFTRHRWQSVCLGLVIGAGSGGVYANSLVRSDASAFGADLRLVPIGAAAGALGGLAIALLVGRIKARWRAPRGIHPVAVGSQGERWGVGMVKAAANAPPGAEAARLRRRVQRSGWCTIALRLLAPVPLVLLFSLISSRLARFPWLQPEGLLWLPLLLAVGYLLALPLTLPLAAFYGRRRRRRLGEQLAALSAEQRAAVLLPLQDPARPEVYEIAAPLMRLFQTREVELVPAAPPAGRGDEPASAPG